MNDPKLTVSINKLNTNQRKMNDAFINFITVLNFFNRPEDETLQFKLNSIETLNSVITNITEYVEKTNNSLIDRVSLNDDQVKAAEEIYKIKFNN